MLERVHLQPDLAAFESLIKARVARLSVFEDERFARPTRVERDPATGELTVLAEFITGSRLSDLLEATADAGIVPGVDVALGYLLDTLPALTLLHSTDGITHGLIDASRTVLTPDGQIVFLDPVFGSAVERLGLSRQRLWAKYGIASPAGDGLVHLDPAADIAQVALGALALVLGRNLQPGEYPELLPSLLMEVIEVAQIRGSAAFATGLQRFLQRSLPLPGRRPYASADEALSDVRQLVRRDIGVDVCRQAVIDFATQMDAAFGTAPAEDEDGEDTASQATERQAPGPDPRVPELDAFLDGVNHAGSHEALATEAEHEALRPRRSRPHRTHPPRRQPTRTRTRPSSRSTISVGLTRHAGARRRGDLRPAAARRGDGQGDAALSVGAAAGARLPRAGADQVRRARAGCHTGYRRYLPAGAGRHRAIFQIRRSSRNWRQPNRTCPLTMRRSLDAPAPVIEDVPAEPIAATRHVAAPTPSAPEPVPVEPPEPVAPEAAAAADTEVEAGPDKDSASSRRRKRQQQKSARARKDKLRSTTADQKTPPPPVPVPEPARPASPTGWLVSPQRAAQFEAPVPLPMPAPRPIVAPPPAPIRPAPVAVPAVPSFVPTPVGPLPQPVYPSSASSSSGYGTPSAHQPTPPGPLAPPPHSARAAADVAGETETRAANWLHAAPADARGISADPRSCRAIRHSRPRPQSAGSRR